MPRKNPKPSSPTQSNDEDMDMGDDNSSEDESSKDTSTRKNRKRKRDNNDNNSPKDSPPFKKRKINNQYMYTDRDILKIWDTNIRTREEKLSYFSDKEAICESLFKPNNFSLEKMAGILVKKSKNEEEEDIDLLNDNEQCSFSIAAPLDYHHDMDDEDDDINDTTTTSSDFSFPRWVKNLSTAIDQTFKWNQKYPGKKITRHKIILPYTHRPSHYNAASTEFTIEEKKISSFTFTAYEPSVYEDTFPEGFQIVLTNLMRDKYDCDEEAVKFDLKDTRQQTDAYSHGVIATDNGLKLIPQVNKQQIDGIDNKIYFKHATEESRKRHLEEVKSDAFYTKQLNNLIDIGKEQFIKVEEATALIKAYIKQKNLQKSFLRHAKHFTRMSPDNKDANIESLRQWMYDKRSKNKNTGLLSKKLSIYQYKQKELNTLKEKTSIQNTFFKEDTNHFKWKMKKTSIHTLGTILMQFEAGGKRRRFRQYDRDQGVPAVLQLLSELFEGANTCVALALYNNDTVYYSCNTTVELKIKNNKKTLDKLTQGNYLLLESIKDYFIQCTQSNDYPRTHANERKALLKILFSDIIKTERITIGNLDKDKLITRVLQGNIGKVYTGGNNKRLQSLEPILTKAYKDFKQLERLAKKKDDKIKPILDATWKKVEPEKNVYISDCNKYDTFGQKKTEKKIKFSLHAEVKILEEIIKNKLYDTDTDIIFGISKLCCMACRTLFEIAIEAFHNQKKPLKITFPGWHDQYFDNWAYPLLFKSNANSEDAEQENKDESAIFAQNIGKAMTEYLNQIKDHEDKNNNWHLSEPTGMEKTPESDPLSGAISTPEPLSIDTPTLLPKESFIALIKKELSFAFRILNNVYQKIKALPRKDTDDEDRKEKLNELLSETEEQMDQLKLATLILKKDIFKRWFCDDPKIPLTNFIKTCLEQLRNSLNSSETTDLVIETDNDHPINSYTLLSLQANDIDENFIQDMLTNKEMMPDEVTQKMESQNT